MSWKSVITQSRATIPAFAAEGLFWGGIAAYSPALKAQIGADDGTFGIVLLFGSIGALSAMMLAPLVDRKLGRFAVPVCAVAMAVSMQGFIRATDPVFFAVLLLFAGATSGLLDVVMNARLSRIEAAKGASLMNFNHGLFSLAYAFSAIISGLSREAGVSISWIFGVWLVVILLGTPWMVQAVENATANRDAPPAKSVLRAAVAWGGLICLIAFLAENATESWSALHVERTLGGTATEGALGPAMLGLTMAFGRFSGQVIVSRFHEATVVFWAALVAGAGAVIAAVAPFEWVAYVGFAVLGLGVSVIAPMVFALVGRRVPDSIRATAISRVAIIGYIGFFVGPPAMGLISEGFGLRASFFFVGIVLLLIPGLLVLLRRIERA